MPRLLALFSLLAACDGSFVPGGPAAGTCDTSTVTITVKDETGAVSSVVGGEFQWYDEGYVLVDCPSDTPAEGVTCNDDGSVTIVSDAATIAADIWSTDLGPGEEVSYTYAGDLEPVWDTSTDCATGTATVIASAGGECKDVDCG